MSISIELYTIITGLCVSLPDTTMSLQWQCNRYMDRNGAGWVDPFDAPNRTGPARREIEILTRPTRAYRTYCIKYCYFSLLSIATVRTELFYRLQPALVVIHIRTGLQDSSRTVVYRIEGRNRYTSYLIHSSIDSCPHLRSKTPPRNGPELLIFDLPTTINS